MTTTRAIMAQSVNKIGFALKPLRLRWDALESRPRRLVLIGAMVLAAGLTFAYGWLPAVRTRDAMSLRLPQLELQLANMRKQGEEVKALAQQPSTPIAIRTAADVAALQTIFGADAQVAAAGDGFHIVMPAVAYGSWWDKTGDALSRHRLVLRTATLTRVDDAKAAAPVVAVDMLLAVDARALVSVAGSAANPASTPTSQGK